MNRSSWTTLEFQIIEALARKVALLTPALVARAWSFGPIDRRDPLAQPIQRLWQAGLLSLYRVNLHPHLTPRAPIVRWRPGQPAPDFRAVSRQLKERWKQAARPTTVLVASRQAANLFGTTAGQLPATIYRNHDLLLAEVFAHYQRTAPQLAQLWVGEQALPKAGYRIKDPDAFLIRGDTVERVIESGGAYSGQQIRSFHQHCQQLRLPYELW